jgi:phospholipase A1
MKRSWGAVGAVLVVIFLPMVTVTQAVGQPAPDEFQIITTKKGLSLHKEMFMLPASVSNEYNGAQTEAVFQLSAKYRIFETPLYFAYTQISFWQAYDYNNSAPFRETNYNPELFYRTGRTEILSGQVGADIGFEHESNGQRPPVSRSWNLLYASPYYYRRDWLVYLKFRYRIPEDEKEFPEATVGDDNPDITDFLGHTDLHVFYRLPWRHTVHFRIQGNIGKGKGGLAFQYRMRVPKSIGSFVVVRFSHGYGESLVDYRRNLTRIGVGIMFGD